MSVYSIKDLEHLSGIKAHTLRIWEQRYGILNPERTDTNIRTYGDEELKLVLNIAILQSRGDFKISEIAKMSDSERSANLLRLSEGNLHFPDQIQALTISMLELNEAMFQQLTKNIIQKHGFEDYLIQIIHPFMLRLGTLWLSGSVGPAQEHFISHLIRQKVIAAIDQQDLSYKPTAKKFLLYLPEGELHEIGLLFANYILRARKHQVIYLGQSLPFEELVLAYDIHQPDYILSVFTSQPNPDDMPDYLEQLVERIPNSKILLTGYQLLALGHEVPEKIHVLRSFQELIELANTN
ncbi:MerR family transcriptional regulator [Aquirufa ecclesiirivi]|uniref:MerR family transcriptional regulator n=1 Tax=Aquirufa ecclesiirivi TaxID=2715124 RepID=UPI00140AFFE2|nr:MerR family transcriptional regulator [Aquirufa ecclesiirivi]NHC49392.1 MerR family transcriptional regulator [Aquirufa ecclesiirivi]